MSSASTVNQVWCHSTPVLSPASLFRSPVTLPVCGEGKHSLFTHRLATHLGSATKQSQVDTVKPVGSHFRLPGHHPHGDCKMVQIEKINSSEPFVREAREAYYIKMFETQKLNPVTEIEHGLNLDKGQCVC